MTTPRKSIAGGEFFVLKSGGFVSLAIRVLTRSPVNHAGIILPNRDTIEAEAAGAVRKHVRPGMIISSELPLTEKQRKAIAFNATNLLTTPYNFVDIAALAFAQFGITNRYIHDRIADNGKLICSQLVDLAYLNSGVHLFNDGRAPLDVTPGDLALLLLERPWESDPKWGTK